MIYKKIVKKSLIDNVVLLNTCVRSCIYMPLQDDFVRAYTLATAWRALDILAGLRKTWFCSFNAI